MGLVVSVAPSQFPITTQDGKDHCRIDGSDEDSLVRSYIAAATAYIEAATDQVLCTRTYELTLEEWGGEIVVPVVPLVSVSSITYTDVAGDTQTLAGSVYFVDTTTPTGRIVLKPNQSWPALGDAVYPISITFIAGAAPASVSEAAKQAVRLLVSHFYENREATSEGALSAVPLAVESLMSTLYRGTYP